MTPNPKFKRLAHANKYTDRMGNQYEVISTKFYDESRYGGAVLRKIRELRNNEAHKRNKDFLLKEGFGG